MKFNLNPRSLMFTRFLMLAAALCLLNVAGNALDVNAQGFDNVERQRAQDMMGVVKDDIKKNYYDATYHGIDVEARFKSAQEKIKQATSLGQALGIIAQAVIDLNDSHTFFSPPARPVHVEYGWRMQMIGDKCYISAIKPGSDAEKQGVKVGDEVIALENFRPTRKEMWKMEYYYFALSPRPGVRLTVQSPNGQPRQLDVAAAVRQDKRTLNLEDTTDLWQLIRASEDADRFYRHRFYTLGNVVIWKMPNFEFEPEQANSIMSDKLRPGSALILDLRGNPGGYTKTLEQLAGNFFDHDLKIADLKGRKEMKPLLAKTHGKSTFDGKLIVLIDSKSASCSEIFARLVQLEKRGIVIGDNSMGAVMQAKGYGHKIGTMTNIYFGTQVTDADVITSDGKSLEHVGVTPDKLMLPMAEDLAAKRDPVMAFAVELLGGKLEPEKAGAMFPVEWMKAQ